MKIRTNLLVLIMTATGFFSCGQVVKPTQEAVSIKNLDSVKNSQSQKAFEKYIHTNYEYTDTGGARLVIQNSFPKSGIKYTDPAGKNYVYAVFFTRIINDTKRPFELRLDFPTDSFELPASSGNYFKILLLPGTITVDKLPLFDYGLVVKSFLDTGIHQSFSLKRTIHPKASNGFYVVTLSKSGVGGTLRTGLTLQEQNLVYKINDKEIHCGRIDFQKLTLQK